jgi:hypothetical protein
MSPTNNETQNKIDPVQRIYTITTENYFMKNTHTVLPSPSPKKKECIDAIIAKNDKSIHLFSEDIAPEKGMKRFFGCNYETIYKYARTQKCHLYEHYEADDELKLFIDVDVYIKKIPENTNHKKYLRDLMMKVVLLINGELDKKGIKDPGVIILESNRDDKLSTHLIYPTVSFKNIQCMKIFMMGIKSDLIDDGLIDLSVYRVGGLRIMYASKAGKNIPLKFMLSRNYDDSKPDKQLFLDTLLLNLPENHQRVHIDEIGPQKVIQRIRTRRVKKNVPNNGQNATNGQDNGGVIGFTLEGEDKMSEIEVVDKKTTNTPISILSKYLEVLDVKRADKYHTWLQVGYILFSCNPTLESFNLWDDWSKLSTSYDSRDLNIYKWNSFNWGSCGIASLKYLCKKDNPAKYMTIEESIDKPLYESIKFRQQYLLKSENEVLRERKSVVAKNIDDFMTDANIKSLAIKSPYNTGKTAIVKKILTEYNIQKVLFISYRQSLAYDLYGNFYKLGIESYKNKKYGANKLICQIESLKHIVFELMTGPDEVELPSYDMVIIDESESSLNHFTSPTIEKKRFTFETMEGIMNNSTKLLFLDGDFHNRSYTFMNRFGKSIILENTIQKNLKHFKFITIRSDFEKQIDDALEKGENVIIVSMSSTIAQYLYTKYEKKYKSLLHIKQSDDKYKKLLVNVDELWVQYQVVIYSPSIEAGVNFNPILPHFDRQFVVLSSKSTTPRALMQMMSRAREIISDDVLVYLNNMEYNEHAAFYQFDEVKEFIKNINHKYYKPTRLINPVTNKISFKYQFDSYATNYVYNKLEECNASSKIFVPYLIKLIKEKGHTCEYIVPKKKARVVRPVIVNQDVNEAVNGENVGENNGENNDENVGENNGENNDGNIGENAVNGENNGENVGENAGGNAVNGENGAAYEEVKSSLIIDSILNAPDINSIGEYNELKAKMINHMATSVEKFSMEKYEILKFWNIGAVTKEFLNTYYNKNQVLANLRYYISPHDTTKRSISNLDNDDATRREMRLMILEVNHMLGFVTINSQVAIKSEDFLDNLKKVLTMSEFFTDLNKSQPLFNFSKSKIGKIKTCKGFIGIWKTVLQQWGLTVKVNRKNVKRNKKVIKLLSYTLNYIHDINKYI